MLSHVLVDKLAECQRAAAASLTAQTLKRTFERLARVPLGRETTPLHTPRVAATDPIRPARGLVGTPFSLNTWPCCSITITPFDAVLVSDRLIPIDVRQCQNAPKAKATRRVNRILAPLPDL
jgi:hypothetical protein